MKTFIFVSSFLFLSCSPSSSPTAKGEGKAGTNGTLSIQPLMQQPLLIVPLQGRGHGTGFMKPKPPSAVVPLTGKSTGSGTMK
jgi:hypothetical protein